jgi:hypothetical protein
LDLFRYLQVGAREVTYLQVGDTGDVSRVGVSRYHSLVYKDLGLVGIMAEWRVQNRVFAVRSNSVVEVQRGFRRGQQDLLVYLLLPFFVRVP